MPVVQDRRLGRDLTGNAGIGFVSCDTQKPRLRLHRKLAAGVPRQRDGGLIRQETHTPWSNPRWVMKKTGAELLVRTARVRELLIRKLQEGEAVRLCTAASRHSLRVLLNAKQASALAAATLLAANSSVAPATNASLCKEATLAA